MNFVRMSEFSRTYQDVSHELVIRPYRIDFAREHVGVKEDGLLLGGDHRDDPQVEGEQHD